MVIALLDPVVDFLQSLAFIGEDSHVVKLHYIDSQIQPIADSLGMGLPLIKVCLTGYFPSSTHHHQSLSSSLSLLLIYRWSFTTWP